MKAPRIQVKELAEAKLSRDFTAFLSLRNWVVMKTHGNKYQKGFPDLLCLHHIYGSKWVELKILPGAIFTAAQLTSFPRFSEAKVPVYIIKECTEKEYKKLHGESNWVSFLARPDVYNRGNDKSTIQLTVPDTNPEGKIQNQIMEKLRSFGWSCLPTCGNLYQHGFPDIYCLHPHYGGAWVEVKRRNAFSITPAQRKYFPIMHQAKQKIYILTDKEEHTLMFNEKTLISPNWSSFFY